MLVLTRRKNEEVWLDNGRIKVRVIYARRGNVALGFSAPGNVDVDRKEIFLRKQENPDSNNQ